MDRTPFSALPRVPIHLVVAFAVALGVAAPVAGVFGTSGSLAALLPLAAFVFTAITVHVAPRARSGGRVALGLVVGCLVPPTVIFLPTIIGLVVAVPAGLLALAAVTPIVLVARRTRLAPCDDDAEHLLAVTAVWLTVVSVGLLLALRNESPEKTCLPLPGLALAGLLAGVVLCRDIGRTAFVAGVARGWERGYRLTIATPLAPALVHGRYGLRALVFETVSGDGPFRSHTAMRLLGTVRVPWARLAMMLATAFVVLLTLVQ